MEKWEFYCLEKLCKESWKKIAKLGCSKYEIPKLRPFAYWCPACTIALKGDGYADCSICPVDQWRKLAGFADTIQQIPCQLPESPYEVWRMLLPFRDEAKEAALVISKMSWSYLSEYADIEIEDLVEEYE